MGEKGNAAVASDLATQGADFASGLATEVATGTATGLTKDAVTDAVQRARNKDDESPGGSGT